MNIEDILRLNLQERRRFLLTISAGFAVSPIHGVAAFAQGAPNAVPPDSHVTNLAAVTGVRGNIWAVVYGKKDEPVQNLGKDDFVLHESGRPLQIRYASFQPDLPSIVGILVNNSAWGGDQDEKERTACQTFINSVLRTQDLGFAMTFGEELELIQQLTSSRPDLVRAIHNVQLEITTGRAGFIENLLYDAVVACTDVLGREQGRRALVVMAAGVDRYSHVALPAVIKAVQRAGVVVYCLKVSPGDRHEPDKWKNLSSETGGRFDNFFRALPLNPVRKFAEIEADLRNQYLLGFEPSPGSAGFRSIQLIAKDKHLEVRAQTRYYVE